MRDIGTDKEIRSENYLPGSPMNHKNYTDPSEIEGLGKFLRQGIRERDDSLSEVVGKQNNNNDPSLPGITSLDRTKVSLKDKSLLGTHQLSKEEISLLKIGKGKINLNSYAEAIKNLNASRLREEREGLSDSRGGESLDTTQVGLTGMGKGNTLDPSTETLTPESIPSLNDGRATLGGITTTGLDNTRIDGQIESTQQLNTGKESLGITQPGELNGGVDAITATGTHTLSGETENLKNTNLPALNGDIVNLTGGQSPAVSTTADTLEVSTARSLDTTPHTLTPDIQIDSLQGNTEPLTEPGLTSLDQSYSPINGTQSGSLDSSKESIGVRGGISLREDIANLSGGEEDSLDQFMESLTGPTEVQLATGSISLSGTTGTQLGTEVVILTPSLPVTQVDDSVETINGVQGVTSLSEGVQQISNPRDQSLEGTAIELNRGEDVSLTGTAPKITIQPTPGITESAESLPQGNTGVTDLPGDSISLISPQEVSTLHEETVGISGPKEVTSLSPERSTITWDEAVKMLGDSIKELGVPTNQSPLSTDSTSLRIQKSSPQSLPEDSIGITNPEILQELPGSTEPLGDIGEELTELDTASMDSLAITDEVDSLDNGVMSIALQEQDSLDYRITDLVGAKGIPLDPSSEKIGSKAITELDSSRNDTTAQEVPPLDESVGPLLQSEGRNFLTVTEEAGKRVIKRVHSEMTGEKGNQAPFLNESEEEISPKDPGIDQRVGADSRDMIDPTVDVSLSGEEDRESLSVGEGSSLDDNITGIPVSVLTHFEHFSADEVPVPVREDWGDAGKDGVSTAPYLNDIEKFLSQEDNPGDKTLTREDYQGKVGKEGEIVGSEESLSLGDVGVEGIDERVGSQDSVSPLRDTDRGEKELIGSTDTVLSLEDSLEDVVREIISSRDSIEAPSGTPKDNLGELIGSTESLTEIQGKSPLIGLPTEIPYNIEDDDTAEKELIGSSDSLPIVDGTHSGKEEEIIGSTDSLYTGTVGVEGVEDIVGSHDSVVSLVVEGDSEEKKKIITSGEIISLEGKSGGEENIIGSADYVVSLREETVPEIRESNVELLESETRHFSHVGADGKEKHSPYFSSGKGEGNQAPILDNRQSQRETDHSKKAGEEDKIIGSQGSVVSPEGFDGEVVPEIVESNVELLGSETRHFSHVEADGKEKHFPYSLAGKGEGNQAPLLDNRQSQVESSEDPELEDTLESILQSKKSWYRESDFSRRERREHDDPILNQSASKPTSDWNPKDRTAQREGYQDKTGTEGELIGSSSSLVRREEDNPNNRSIERDDYQDKFGREGEIIRKYTKGGESLLRSETRHFSHAGADGEEKQSSYFSAGKGEGNQAPLLDNRKDRIESNGGDELDDSLEESPRSKKSWYRESDFSRRERREYDDPILNQSASKPTSDWNSKDRIITRDKGYQDKVGTEEDVVGDKENLPGVDNTSGNEADATITRTTLGDNPVVYSRQYYEAMMKYMGLKDIEDAEKYQMTLDQFMKCGDWGARAAAYFSSMMHKHTGIRDLVPMEEIQWFKSLVSQTATASPYDEDSLRRLFKEDAEAFRKSAEENKEKSFNWAPGLDRRMDTDVPKDLEAEIGTMMTILSSGIQNTFTNGAEVKDSTEGEVKSAFEHSTNKPIPRYKLPEYNWNTGTNASSYIRWAVEETFGTFNGSPALKKTLIEEALALAILAREEAEKLTQSSRYRLPGTPPDMSPAAFAALQAGGGLVSGSSLTDMATTQAGILMSDPLVSPVNRPSESNGDRIMSKADVAELGDYGDSITRGTVFESNRDSKITWNAERKAEETHTIGLVGRMISDVNNITKNTAKALTKARGLKQIPFTGLAMIGDGMTNTFCELVSGNLNTVEEHSSYSKFREALLNSPYMTTSSRLIDWKFSDVHDIMTLDSNHVWEIKLFPYVGKLNGRVSFLPSIGDINQENYRRFGYYTHWDKWIPFSSFELSQAKTLSKSLQLFDGEISYPSSIEFSNELRLSLVDDTYKSWKRYFTKVADASVYLSEPHNSDYYSKSPLQFTDDLITRISKHYHTPGHYKNLTFECIIYVMNPQLYTVKKLDLLVVMRDFNYEWQGEIDASPTDLSIAFSVVGENPWETSVPGAKIAESLKITRKETPTRTNYGNILRSATSEVLGIL